ncbi:MAG: glycosyltransferase family 2 protein [Nocardioides sp.]
MRFSVSTVKDTPENVERFVAGNLAGGIDHLVVFLDDPDDPATSAVRTLLDAHDHVTCVVADDAWWRGKRPEQLNVRQRINANLVRSALTLVERAEWVFHIDGDEMVRLDPAAMAAVPATEHVVQLAPLEAVSRRRWDAPPTWFKRLLAEPELTLLQVLGTIDRAHNGAYFHGHVEGKTGVRPAHDVWLALHRALDESGNEVAAYRHDDLSVLHFESWSGEDFVRKWTSVLAAGPMAAFRPARAPTAIALRALLDRGLTEEQAAPLLMRIFERTTQDDFETLRTLNLLEEVDPMRPLAEPESLTADEREGISGLLEALATRPKRPFHPGQPAAGAEKILSEAAGGRRRLFRR